MKIQTTKPRPLIPAGEQLLCLTAVVVKPMPNTFKRKPSDPDEVDRMVWEFTSRSTDPDSGDPYQYGVWTGTQYGDTRSAMTKLLDQLVPGITILQAEELDTDELIDKWFRARIKHVKADNGDMKAEHTMLEPYVSKAKAAEATPAAATKPRPAAPPPPDEEEDPKDPFAGN